MVSYDCGEIDESFADEVRILFNYLKKNLEALEFRSAYLAGSRLVNFRNHNKEVRGGTEVRQQT